MDTSSHPDRTVEQLALELLARWRSMGIDLVPGASEGQIRHFRMRNGVALPDDLAQFFRIVGGMREGEMDTETLFRFWPLGELTAEPLLRDYFAFADFSILAETFAIQLTADAREDHPVVIVREPPIAAGTSFRDFLNRYVEDDLRLIPRSTPSPT